MADRSHQRQSEMTIYTLEQVRDRLREFTSADEIAAYFTVLGIHGEPCEAQRCPIANLIVEACRPEYEDEINVDKEEMTDGSGESLGMPAAASTFVEKFDGWCYPTCVEER